MFKNVLVGVDGRPNGRDAIALASQLTDPAGKLTLAHVYSGRFRPSHAITPGMVGEEREAAHKLLEEEQATAGVKADLVAIMAMSPGGALHQQAEEQGADLIIVGSCRRSSLGRAMLGDDARAALNGAPCAVAIASLGYAERRNPILNVGVGYNGSPESEMALATARKLAVQTNGAVHALEVVSIPTAAYTGTTPPALGESIELALEEATKRMKEFSDLDGRAVYGLPGEELASLSGDMDLLVVGSRGYGPVKRLILGSTSGYLELHARSSLLVLARAAGQGERG